MATSSTAGGATAVSTATAAKSGKFDYAEMFKDYTTIEGLIKLHRKDDKLYADLGSNVLNRDLIVLISIARGIGKVPLVGGMSWGFGDDWLWQFRKVDAKIQVVRRNVRFSAAKGSPEERAVRLAYTDSVLFSLPILGRSPEGAAVVDLSPLFMSDLPQFSMLLPGFSFARDRSTWAAVKGFRDNVELEVAATYASTGTKDIDTVPDSRGLTLHVHYSLSLLPQTTYQPRLADDRVGYFLTVHKDFSRRSDRDRFVRYINRWDLRKADPQAELSPPKKPIVIWIEKTVPYEFRKPVREGILEWNKAFEKVGLANAIEVRQQADDADWDPEDINYNTFRWITAGAGFAMGPSRVNPTTGEILDADIIFDADFIGRWKDSHQFFHLRTGTGKGSADLFDGGMDFQSHATDHVHSNRPSQSEGRHPCLCCQSMAAQMAVGALAVAVRQPNSKIEPADPKLREFLMQGVKWVVMHEVGHTLGLRHNFKASAWLSLDEINRPEKTKETGIAASVMDYIPVNVSPKGKPQGDYFSTTIGPYDFWAIEYGYKPASDMKDSVSAQLKKIASRTGEPALAYATDEESQVSDPDPMVNRYDLGKDLVESSRWRNELVAQLWPDLADRITQPGESYDKTRRAFGLLLSYQSSGLQYAARLIGGVSTSRAHKGDPNGQPPYMVIEPAKQRQALALLAETAFAENAYRFPAEMFRWLDEPKWSHWGVRQSERTDFPLREVILGHQDHLLGQLLSPATLSRLADSELKVPADQDAFTSAELFAGLTKSLFRETEHLAHGQFTNRKPAIGGLRRDLQRRYLDRLSNLALGRGHGIPNDCRMLASAELETIQGRMKAVLVGKVQLDAYTQAHLKDSIARIQKVLDARLELQSP